LLKLSQELLRVYFFSKEGLFKNHSNEARAEFIARSCDGLGGLWWLYNSHYGAGMFLDRKEFFFHGKKRVKERER
jgi:hypothetical protein